MRRLALLSKFFDRITTRRMQLTTQMGSITPRHGLRPNRLNAGVLACDFLVAAAGLTATLVLKVIGSLPVSEMFLLPAFPILILISGRRLRMPLFWRILALLLVWQIGELLSDLYRQTAMYDWLRGSANIAFFVVDYCCLAILLAGNRRRQVLFIASLAVGSIMHAFLVPAITLGDSWKWGYCWGASVLAALLGGYFYRRSRYGLVLALMTAIIAVDLLDNYRSAMLTTLVSTVLVVPIVPERVSSLRLLPRAGSVGRSVVLILMTVLGGGIATTLVHWVTHSGLLSQPMEQKNEMQENAQGGLLLGGRAEIFVSARAVLASPILGYGSWAKDPFYAEMYNQIEAEQTGAAPQPLAGDDLIPSHSHLMGTWVYDGILGAICWAYIFWLNARAVLYAPIMQSALVPAYALLLVNFGWAILFSPLGSTTRIVDALALVIILDVLKRTASADVRKFVGRRPAAKVARSTTRTSFSRFSQQV